MKRLKLGIRLWNRLEYHVFYNQWKAASNICKRMDRLKYNWFERFITNELSLFCWKD